MFFYTLLTPVVEFLVSHAANIDQKSGSKKLFFEDFCKKMFFAILTHISSLRSLVTELESNQTAQHLGLCPTAFSTFKDAFQRFDAKYFKAMYESVLQSWSWEKVPYLQDLGILCAVDGSLFPVISQMDWAVYKKTKNACKLHLCFELNRMITTQFWLGSGNSSERKALLCFLQEAVTYIVDRGYFSFDLVQKISVQKAFFVCRIKENIHFKVVNLLPIAVAIPACFRQVQDQLVQLDNDPYQNSFRLVCFFIHQKKFFLLTNRLDLNTLQIILLYALRWQIELLFKFLKCSLHAIHLFNQSENGIQVQLYLWLTIALLQIRCKQVALLMAQQNPPENTVLVQYFGYAAETFVQLVNQNFQEKWKISKNFLILMKNSLTKNASLTLFIAFSSA